MKRRSSNTFRSLTLALGLAVATGAHAGIEIDGDDEATSVDVVNETNLAILQRLAGHFGFDFTVNDRDWAMARRDFASSGSKERVIRAFFIGENYMLGYSEGADGERINHILLLGEGEAITFQASTPGQAQSPATPQAVRGTSEATAAARQTSSRTSESRTVTQMMEKRIAAQRPAVSAAPSGSAAASVSESATSSTPSSAQGTAHQQDELRRLTAQARQDVEHLAQALKAAESKVREAE